MNILVISEAFCFGGLETQIKTYYDYIKNAQRGVNLVFAFGRCTQDTLLEDARIYTGFHFSASDSIAELCEDVERLIQIIREESIDVIHVHPFYSFYAALFAAQMTGIKLVYTYHGIGSINFPTTVTAQAVFRFAFERSAVNKAFCVSKNGTECFQRIGYQHTCLLLNPIDYSRFAQVKRNAQGKWALISRLDGDKLTEIKMLLEKKDDFGIGCIDVYGDGSKTEELHQFIAEHGLGDTVVLKGYSSNIPEVMKNGYQGVIGIGRVLLEAMTMGMTAFLIGYGKITGFVNKEIYHKLKVLNFSNMLLNDYNDTRPDEDEIKQIQEDVKLNFDIPCVVDKYIREIDESEAASVSAIRKLYEAVRELAGSAEHGNEMFHHSRKVLELVQVYIRSVTTDSLICASFANMSADIEYVERRIRDLELQIAAQKRTLLEKCLRKIYHGFKRLIRHD